MIEPGRRKRRSSVVAAMGAWLLLPLTMAAPPAPPAPEPGRSAIGLRILKPPSKGKLAWSLGMSASLKVKATQAYFLKLDEADPYAVNGSVFAHYSWLETAYFCRKPDSFRPSNWYGEGYVYLLNVEPGRYVVTGATIVDAGGVGRVWDATFTNEMAGQTEVTVGPDEFVFLGDYVVQELKGVPPLALQSATATHIWQARKAAFEELNKGRKHPYPTMFFPAVFGIEDVSRDAAEDSRFWKETAKALKRQPAWLELPRRTPGHAESVSVEIEIAKKSQDALRFVSKGKLDRAALAADEALELASGAFGEHHTRVAVLFANESMIHRTAGSDDRRRSALSRALEIREAALGDEHPAIAHSILSLALVYLDQGEYSKALPMIERASKIREKSLGPEHLDTAVAWSMLAECHAEMGHADLAVSLQERVVDIFEKELGPGHLEVAAMLNNLGIVYDKSGEPEQAMEAYQRALSMRQDADAGLAVAETLLNVALLHRNEGRLEQAMNETERALAILQEQLPGDHWLIADVLMAVAQYRMWAGASTVDIHDLMARSGEIRDREIRRAMPAGSEEANLDYIAKVASGQIDGVLTLQTRGESPDSDLTELGLITVLRFKGRVLDATARHLDAARKRMSSEEQELWDEMIEIRQELAQAALHGPSGDKGEEKLLAKLGSRLREVEAILMQRSSELRRTNTAITIEAVERRIPEHAALVEYVRFREPKLASGRDGPTHSDPLYGAYVLRPGEDPVWTALGDAAPIDRLAKELREALESPTSEGYRETAEALYDAIVRPIRTHLAETDFLLLSPDGDLHLVPFATLIGDDGRFLVEHYLLTYVTSGRDLVRLDGKASPREPARIFAAPDFDFGGDAFGSAGEGQRSAHFGEMSFAALPGTASEASAIQALVPDATTLTGPQATESAIKSVQGPRLLHVATHGFFLENPPAPAEEIRGSGSPTVSGPGLLSGPPRVSGTLENPLLRSGLVLAGANHLSDGRDDGVLTALELSGIDLRGTRLVVLSACETGVGEVRRSEGVFGLRRALVLAGSESQVMSLWRVADEPTRELMTLYYTGLNEGRGRSEALRRAQLEMIADEALSHPFFWGPFIQSGDWRPLPEKNVEK